MFPSCAANQQSLFKRLLHRRRLWSGRASRLAERHLGDEGPGGRDVEGGLCLVVDEGVVVLQVGAEAGVAESGPEDELVDGRRVLGPLAELVLDEGELVLERARVLRVLEEEHRAVRVAEAGQAGLGARFELFGRRDGLDHFGHQVPELVVFVLEQEDEAGRVGAECGGGFFEGGLEDLLDLLVGDGGLGGEGVVGATFFDELEELELVGLACHCDEYLRIGLIGWLVRLVERSMQYERDERW